MWKTDVREEEKLYGNGLDSAILFRARTNTLDLQWRKRFVNEDTICKLCNRQDETIEYFILDCEKLNIVRSQFLILMRPYPENTDDIVKRLLLFQTEKEEDILKHRKIIYKLWKAREKKLKEI